MADGMVITDLDNDVQAHSGDALELKTNPVAKFLSGGVGQLIACAMVVFLLLLGTVTWQLLSPGILSSDLSRIVFVGATAFFWLPLLLTLLDSPDNFKKGPNIFLPTACLTLLGGLTVFAIANRVMELGALTPATADTSESRAIRAVFFIFLALAFIPLVWNAVNRAHFELKVKGQQPSHQDASERRGHDEEAEAMSALLATVTILAIGGLAFGAGIIGDSLSFPNSFGLVLCSTVIGIFAIVVFIDTISEWHVVRFTTRLMREVARFFKPLAKFYNHVDSLLVRVGASVCGMQHRTTKARYSILVGQLTCLALLGWWLPAPYGLLPCFLALVLAVSVSRLWSWVEEDRALAAMTNHHPLAPYKVGFREDFRDETLLGFIFVFALVPIAMMQAHVGDVFGEDLFKNADAKGFSSWIGYFGVELAKAVPIVDWAEIYSVSPGNDLIQMNGTASRHAVFLARVMVDLVLIAALLQAMAITGRNRQQKRLYSSKQILRLDTFVERTELKRAVKLSLVRPFPEGPEDIPLDEAKSLFNLRAGVAEGAVDFRHYDEHQLRFVYGASKDRKLRAFISVLAHERKMPLASAIDLALEIAEGDLRELDLFRAFERARSEDTSGRHKIEPNDLYRMLTALRVTSGLKAFKFELIDMFVKTSDPDEVMEKLPGFIVGGSADQFKYTREYIAEKLLAVADDVRSSLVIEQALNVFRKIDPAGRVLSPGTRKRVVEKLKARWQFMTRRDAQENLQ